MIQNPTIGQAQHKQESNSDIINSYRVIQKSDRSTQPSGVYLFERENELYIKGAISSRVTNDGNNLILEGELGNGKKFKIKYDKQITRVTVIGMDSKVPFTDITQNHELDISEDYPLKAYSLNGGKNIEDSLIVKKTPLELKISVQGDYNSDGSVPRDSVTLLDEFGGTITMVSGDKEIKKYSGSAFPRFLIGNVEISSEDTYTFNNTPLPGDKRTYTFNLNDEPRIVTPKSELRLDTHGTKKAHEYLYQWVRDDVITEPVYHELVERLVDNEENLADLVLSVNDYLKGKKLSKNEINVLFDKENNKWAVVRVLRVCNGLKTEADLFSSIKREDFFLQANNSLEARLSMFLMMRRGILNDNDKNKWSNLIKLNKYGILETRGPFLLKCFDNGQLSAQEVNALLDASEDTFSQWKHKILFENPIKSQN